MIKLIEKIKKKKVNLGSEIVVGKNAKWVEDKKKYWRDFWAYKAVDKSYWEDLLNTVLISFPERHPNDETEESGTLIEVSETSKHNGDSTNVGKGEIKSAGDVNTLGKMVENQLFPIP